MNLSHLDAYMVNVQFQNERHSVLGIATIVAIKKGEGYGRINGKDENILVPIKQYRFLWFFGVGFYEEWLQILKGGVKRVVYQDDSDDYHRQW